MRLAGIRAPKGEGALGASTGGAGRGGAWLRVPPSPGGWSLTPPRARVARGRAAAAKNARTAALPELGGRRRDAARPAARAAGLASPGRGARRPAGFADAGLCLRRILS